MEIVLAEVTKEVEESEARIVELKDRIHYALMQKDARLCETVDMHQTDSDVDAAGDDDDVLVELAPNNIAFLELSDLQEKYDADVVNSEFSG
jgi:hypothetical protein